MAWVSDVMVACYHDRCYGEFMDETSTCRHCGQTVTLLYGDWTDPDGCTNCMADTSAVYAPHQPKENES